MRKTCVLVVLGLIAAAIAAPTAQEPAAAQGSPGLTPLKIQVVLARYNGDKKVSNIPYTFSVNSTPQTMNRQPVQLRMGVEVPVPTTSFTPGAAKEGVTSFAYRNVGTNIDCTATDGGGGRFNVLLSVEHSAIHDDEARRQNRRVESVTGLPPAPAIAAQPMFSSFKATLTVLLKDGQSTQFVSATDPVSGEVLKIDVTLNVVK